MSSGISPAEIDGGGTGSSEPPSQRRASSSWSDIPSERAGPPPPAVIQDAQSTSNHPEAAPFGTVADAESVTGPRASRATPSGWDAVETGTLSKTPAVKSCITLIN